MTTSPIRAAVPSYLEGSYNPRRRQSWLGNLSFTDYEQQLMTQQEASA
ncbi:hypothetical protein GCM10009767_15010 [Kocuria aegyptia]|uniref:Integrase catalytic domain-containing protein n=1 Tax=Kocuria aegyptia TaxID=330943 RepID=A0ABN2KK17_9MICC